MSVPPGPVGTPGGADPWAVFGGSFDPPHIGHTLVPAYVLGLHAVARVLVVPADAHPFGKPLSPFADRMHMCQLAFGDGPRVGVSDVATELGPEGRTLDLLRLLRRQHPSRALRLVIGTDLLSEVDRWHRFDAICELAPPLWVPRRGHLPAPRPGDDQPDVALPEVSSTEVRRRLREGLPVDRMVHPDVAAHARARALYR